MVAAYAQAPSSAANVTREAFFESKIRPVLFAHCLECHSSENGSLEGGLALDSRNGWEKGGDSGPAIREGDADKSLLLRALRYDSIEMPPSGKLPKAIIDDFAKWIEDGAFDPRESTNGSVPAKSEPIVGDGHWAFQPIDQPDVPLQLESWGSQTVDAFVRRTLHESGWSPAGSVSDEIWLRRVTFDLTGLPPTQQEMAQFAKLDPITKREEVVDRLLASPQYGVRWGRYWLDLVRYADTNGADENHDMPHAWRYRDWVVNALNEDKPFDQFVIEQLAGDLLPMPSDETMAGRLQTATGLLVIGPKMLAEQDKAKMKIDIVDEQIDTISKTFLGVTLSCARCHDHKFDPFTQKDYFALAGILMSTRTMADEAFVSKWMEKPLPSAAIDQLRVDHQSRIAVAKERLAKLRDEANRAVLAIGAFEKLPEKPEEHYPDNTKKEIEDAAKQLEQLEKSIPVYDMAMAVEDAKPIQLPIHIRGNHLNVGDELLGRRPPEVLQKNCEFPAIPEASSGRLQLAHWLTSHQQPLLARVMLNRIWMWHFGQPLVASPSNFGLKGEKPTHPELLDWLAWEWMQRGWSMKELHRLLLLSDTYAIRSDSRKYESEDPENKKLWRQHRRRLEIEPLRDSMLAVCDQLDLKLNGTPGNPRDRRRTLYSKINRAALEDMFATFDYVEPANHIEQRPVTTVPYQSLFLMNHPLVFEAGNRIAIQLLTNCPDESQRMNQLFLLLYARSANDEERSIAAAYLASAKKLLQKSGEAAGSIDQNAWASLVRAMLASHEFSWIP